MRTRRSAIWTKMPTASWQLLVSSYVPRLRGAATDDPPRTNSIRCITLHTRIVSLPTRSKPTSRLQNRSGPPTAIVDAALASKEWPSTPRRGIKSKRIVQAITQGRIMIPRRSILKRRSWKAFTLPTKAKDARGIALDSDAALRRYFEPKLAALIIKDRDEAHGEVDKLDADPFVDAQDWEIDAVDIAIREITPDKAIATVSFKSLGDQRRVVLALVKLKVGWRIADITSDRKETLREFLSKP